MDATDIMFHIPRLWIRSLKVHDSHLADFGLKWNRHIHTQLSRWLDGHILQNGVGEVLSLSWRSISGIEGINNISWVAAEREKAARVSRVLLRVMHYLPFSVSASVAARPGDIEERGTYHKMDCTDPSLAGSWGLDRGSSRGTGHGIRRARRMRG